MAGSEKSGLEATRVNLFEKAVTIISPDLCQDKQALESLAQFWHQVGSIPLFVDVPTHDRLVAAVCHLPPFLAGELIGQAPEFSPEGLMFVGNRCPGSTTFAAGVPD